MSVFNRGNSKNNPTQPLANTGVASGPGSTGGATATTLAASGKAPTDAEIRALAYQKFLARGGKGGDANADWLAAERELKAKYSGGR